MLLTVAFASTPGLLEVRLTVTTVVYFMIRSFQRDGAYLIDALVEGPFMLNGEELRIREGHWAQNSITYSVLKKINERLEPRCFRVECELCCVVVS